MEPEPVKTPHAPERGPRGRGAAANPKNRFEKLEVAPEPEFAAPPAAVRTQFIPDHTCTVIATNDSPDVGFKASVNPYRGCEHGCAYCFARPTHEYLGFSAGLDFETKILVKENAPALLRAELSSRKWVPQTLGMSGVTDPYQPIEKKLQLTRRCLQVLAEFRNPVAIVTKNHLVTRDIDLLRELAHYGAAAVFLSITTLDPNLARSLEPRTSSPEMRLEAARALSQAGIPVGVLVAPVIPAVNDHEIPSILQAAAEAGAKFAGYVPLRLPHGLKGLFGEWLDRSFPDRKEKVLAQVREWRGGKLYESNYGTRMRGTGPAADRLADLFEVARRKAGLADDAPELSAAAFRRPGGSQLSLFD
ncbi:MAG: PA0069 family radical SAM protein [Verrucomicrobiae bacterium]|nr:PA0069 family radical SAM protein [Verrucomicrobiae bacterium]